MKLSQRVVMVWLFLISVSLTSCATGGGTEVRHRFDFDAQHDSPDAEVLDYRYGHSDVHGTYVSQTKREIGTPLLYGGVSGYMPVGESLYVKWRMKDTGEVYEDRVNLRPLLPFDISGHGIHFVVRGPQLYIYLLPPPGIFPALAIKRSFGFYNQKMPRAESLSEDTINVLAFLKKAQIYPALAE